MTERHDHDQNKDRRGKRELLRDLIILVAENVANCAVMWFRKRLMPRTRRSLWKEVLTKESIGKDES